MAVLQTLLDVTLNLDTHVAAVSAEYGALFYGLLFAVIFAETGLVIAAALPSDTVLFAAGALAAKGTLSVGLLFWGGLVASFLGDWCNYAIGAWLGHAFFATRNIPLLKRRHLEEAHRFYAKHGGFTVVAGRFIPVLRSFAPLVGGIAGMERGPFLAYNALGKLIWTTLYVFGGYFLGQIPWLADNFAVLMLIALGVPFGVAGLRLGWTTFRKNCLGC